MNKPASPVATKLRRVQYLTQRNLICEEIEAIEMAVKHKVSPNQKLRTQASAPVQKTPHAPEHKDAKIDAELKSAAGQVQEGLEPIRRSAGHSHTH
jgi:hypothetical protein